MTMFEELKEVRAVLNRFKEVKGTFDNLAAAPVFIGDGDKKKAVEVAQGLVEKAAEHFEVIQHAVVELMDPKTAPEEFARLKAQAFDHKTELAQFLDKAGALVGAELEVIHELIAQRQEAKK